MFTSKSPTAAFDMWNLFLFFSFLLFVFFCFFNLVLLLKCSCSQKLLELFQYNLLI